MLLRNITNLDLTENIGTDHEINSSFKHCKFGLRTILAER